ncbi:hypothetical protein AALO_G00193120 [Alosa alosa]|uniref:Uncharacterized protein n=2 Tax=Alosa alosa TaxID=278164 RepID=A0AAV6G8P3_9TELE|nr:uncharacterized protein LOC125306832 isoform X1 [Alosa alosa]KAG5270482.1 hypothetical protein AALO_G00193120 [Alosa alosa]
MEGRKETKKMKHLEEPLSADSDSSLSELFNGATSSSSSSSSPPHMVRTSKKAQQFPSPSPLPPSSPCWICCLPKTLDTGHASFQGRSYCEVEDGSRGRTAQQWLEEKQWLKEKHWLEVELPKIEQEAAEMYGSSTCCICGHVLTLETGHASFQGHSYCEREAGPDGKTARQWLEEQQASAAAVDGPTPMVAVEPVISAAEPASFQADRPTLTLNLTIPLNITINLTLPSSASASSFSTSATPQTATATLSFSATPSTSVDADVTPSTATTSPAAATTASASTSSASNSATTQNRLNSCGDT